MTPQLEAVQRDQLRGLWTRNMRVPTVAVSVDRILEAVMALLPDGLLQTLLFLSIFPEEFHVEAATAVLGKSVSDCTGVLNVRPGPTVSFLLIYIL